MTHSVNVNEVNGVAEVELIYHSRTRMSDRRIIKNAFETYQLLKEIWDMDTIELFEEFKVILLNSALQVLGIYSPSKGGTGATTVDPKLVFVAALNAMASVLIFAHNHPNGILKPSLADEHLAKKLTEAGKLLDIQVVDHLIISRDGYFSFADQGLL